MTVHKPMSAREVLTVMVRTDRGHMTVWSPTEVQKALDAYRDEVLREAAADLTNGEQPSGACTRCGEPPSAWCPHCAGCACPDGRAEAHAPGGSCPTAPAAEAGAA